MLESHVQVCCFTIDRNRTPNWGFGAMVLLFAAFGMAIATVFMIAAYTTMPLAVAATFAAVFFALTGLLLFAGVWCAYVACMVEGSCNCLSQDEAVRAESSCSRLCV